MAARPLVALRGIWKVFESVTVLRGIDFDIRPGEVHALLGGNGSGKSTMVKILSGAYQPTAGTIEIDGQPHVLARPPEAHARGIYMVPQEPNIFPNLSVMENLVTGLAGDPAEARARAREVAGQIGLRVDFNALGGTLSIANQQLVEIARGLMRNARVLILDEPTSSLTHHEVESLAAQMRALTARGIGILFISHRLDEVLDMSDRVSVLRDGGFVLSEPTARLTAPQLVEAMLPEGFDGNGNGSGNGTGDHEAARAAPGPTRSKAARPVLEVRGLSSQSFHDASFTVEPGEVVGISGVVGSGRTELAEAIFGIDPTATGAVLIDGTPAPRRSPRKCQEMGLSYVPEDRHAHGIFLAMPAAQTISASLLSLGRSHFMKPAEETTLAQRFIDRLRIKLSSPMQVARTLSGGNQQKVVLAKTLAPEPRVVILDEPTRGIDARARQDVYRIIRALTAEGVGVVVISSEVSEIAEVSDRVLIMHRGRLSTLPPGPVDVDHIAAATLADERSLPA
ncbi:MAG TPA: sugar ABC transporter ATP-binding protein [Aliiroseovarius sp.]|nr:sugar ABC transporter ATP-binding protein [Aliiroseovarius sp.]